MNPSVYRLAASAGIPVGIILSFMSACMFLSLYFPLTPLMLLGFVAIPLFLLRSMRRVAGSCPEYNRFTPLWLFGMYSIIFGTLICTLLSSAYVIIFEPDFINTYIDTTMAQLSEGLSGEMQEMHARNVELIMLARERHLLPSPLEFISSLGWSTAFFGVIFTIPLALMAIRRTPAAA